MPWRGGGATNDCMAGRRRGGIGEVAISMAPEDVEDGILQGRARQGGLFAEKVLGFLRLILLVESLILENLETTVENIVWNHADRVLRGFQKRVGGGGRWCGRSGREVHGGRRMRGNQGKLESVIRSSKQLAETEA